MGIEEQFGARLAKLRRAAGLTQAKLAEILGMSPVTISSIERGLHAPGFNRLIPMAEALKVPVYELFNWKEDQA